MLIAFCLLTIGYAYGQDSLRIKNRYGTPDTSVRDTSKLKGGALIDSLHTKPETKEGLKEMQRKPDSLRSSTGSFHYGAIAQNDEFTKRIEKMEARIVKMKKKVGSVSAKTQLASIENQKNELKQRIKNGMVNQPGAAEKWNADIKKLDVKLDALEK